MKNKNEPSHRFVDDYLAALLAQASMLISKEFHVIVQRNGFSVTEWRVLATLTGSEKMSIGQLAQVSITKQPTVTRLLDRMVTRGLVDRFPSSSDRRITLVKITPTGESIISKMIALAKEHETRVLAPIGIDRAEALKTMLRQMIHDHRKVLSP